MIVKPLFFEPTMLKIENCLRATPESLAIELRFVPADTVAEYEKRFVITPRVVNFPFLIRVVCGFSPGLR